eukprot:GGOE01001884.1.p1 GENE.GGOE01001884.1~~GGOE01001884.1.p1  ORF type:complete len:534 (+),score=172.94 GGOE01001884.1:54-1655(+)
MGSPGAPASPEPPGELCEVLREEVAELAQDVQAQRDAAGALRERCVAAVEALDKQDLQELKRFAKPPPLVMLVADAVALLLTGQTGWEEAQRLLADPKFLPSLLAFDPDRVPGRVQRDLQQWVEHPNFKPEVVQKASRACEGLCIWVLAVDQYHKAVRGLRPLEALLAAKEEELTGQTAAPPEVTSPSPTIGTSATSPPPQADEVAALRADIIRCQQELQAEQDRISPALETCYACLGKLKKKHLQELKTMPNPPPAVTATIDAVAFLLTGRVGWDEGKRLLGDSSFLEQLVEYDKDNVPPYVYEGLLEWLEDPTFTPEVVGRAHRACQVLCTWIHAVGAYMGSVRAVGMLQAQLTARQEELRALPAGQAALDTNDAEVAAAILQGGPQASPARSATSAAKSSTAKRVVITPSVMSGHSSVSRTSTNPTRLSVVTCWDGTQKDSEGIDVFVSPGNTLEEIVSKCVRICNFAAGPASLLSLFGRKLQEMSDLQSVSHVLLLPRGQRYQRNATPLAVQRWLQRVDPRPRLPAVWY